MLDWNVWYKNLIFLLSFILQAVVKETLRLHPPGPLSITHSSMEDCTILGYEIPWGTRLVLKLWAIGRNPKPWEDAKIFKPEIFMEAAGFLDAKVQNFQWIPFGVDKRGCHRQQLGMLIVDFVVAQLLHCFNWWLADDMNEPVEIKKIYSPMFFKLRRPRQQLTMLIVEFVMAQLLQCFNWKLPDDMNEPMEIKKIYSCRAIGFKHSFNEKLVIS